MTHIDIQNEQGRYQIRVQGRIDARWADWLENLTITFEIGNDGAEITTLEGQLADQAALHGLLMKLRDLGLTLLSVDRVKA